MTRYGFAILFLVIGGSGVRAQPLKVDGGQSTKFVKLDKPLQALLDDGYEITTMTSGIAGFVYTLHKGHTWALCLFGMSGDEAENTAMSECRSLN